MHPYPDPPTSPPEVVIRPAAPDEGPALQDLYEALDLDDRRNRFLHSFRPPFGFFRDLASVADRGGARLVAVLPAGPGRRHRIVGEAGYALLPGGAGELAMTVAAAWRDRLAAPLLDTLLEHAAGAGVANLETDVLHSDVTIRGLLRSRGAVVAGRTGWTVVRLRVGTRGSTPTCPKGADRPCVLVEAASGRWPAEKHARAAGVDVCPGPDESGCPPLAGEPCALAAGADTIVVSRPPDDERWRALVSAHAELHPDAQVVVEPIDRSHGSSGSDNEAKPG